MHKQLKSVVILSESSSFPWGVAVTTRVQDIARGFLECGVGARYIGLWGGQMLNSVPQRKLKEFYWGFVMSTLAVSALYLGVG